MNESMDRVLADWLDEGPDGGPREGLDRALAATRRVAQRPGWTLPERWLPMQLTMVRTRSLRPILSVATLILLMLALVATAFYVGSQRLPSWPFRNGAIAFAQDGDLFIADQLDGTPRTLVAGPEVDSDPIFSDQGDRIAFVRDTPDDGIVMAVDPDGSDLTKLATLSGAVDLLGWSPDGQALLGVVIDMSAADFHSLYVINGDGSGSRKVDVKPLAGQSLYSGSWRPNGRHIAISSGKAFIVDADGTNVRQLSGPAEVSNLEWSPDGKHLSFHRDDVDQISIADIDENGKMTQLRELALDPESDEHAAKWSPDGSRLAFALIRGSRSQIGVFNPDGSGYRIVGPEVVDPHRATFTWSPDGRSLVILEDPIDDQDTWGKVFSVDVATGEQTEVQTRVESWQRLQP